MKIRAIFFDFGGVIQRTEYQSPRQQLAQRFGMEYEDIDKIVFNSPTARQATAGEIQVEQHWLALAKRFNLTKDEVEKFETDFFAGDVIDHELVNFIRSLRPTYKTGLISNAWSDMREYLIKQKLVDAFDTMTISAEVKSAKPESKIYLHALEKTGVQASEAVFVDDIHANIEACQQLGMNGILFRDVDEVINQIKKLLK